MKTIAAAAEPERYEQIATALRAPVRKMAALMRALMERKKNDPEDPR